MQTLHNYFDSNSFVFKDQHFIMMCLWNIIMVLFSQTHTIKIPYLWKQYE